MFVCYLYIKSLVLTAIYKSHGAIYQDLQGLALCSGTLRSKKLSARANEWQNWLVADHLQVLCMKHNNVVYFLLACLQGVCILVNSVIMLASIPSLGGKWKWKGTASMMTLLFAEHIRTSKQNALGLIGFRAARINGALPVLFYNCLVCLIEVLAQGMGKQMKVWLTSVHITSKAICLIHYKPLEWCINVFFTCVRHTGCPLTVQAHFKCTHCGIIALLISGNTLMSDCKTLYGIGCALCIQQWRETEKRGKDKQHSTWSLRGLLPTCWAHWRVEQLRRSFKFFLLSTFLWEAKL